MSAAKWRRDLEELAAGVGATVTDTRGQHLVIEHPSGWRVYTSRTPGDRRALQYVRSDVRRKVSGVWR